MSNELHGYDWDPEVEKHISKLLNESMEQAKAVWEIDGVTVYVTDIKIEDNKISVDWFTFDNSIDRNVMNRKIEDLATKLIGDKKCLHPLFSRISSTMKHIFGMSGRT